MTGEWDVNPGEFGRIVAPATARKRRAVNPFHASVWPLTCIVDPRVSDARANIAM
ncbi:hypothetical protein MTY66_10060 [Mycolicibacterium sp. TY66]|nr:hypothetical protein MTY66_10060 [Mycolicibacterium sp. TY66]BCJ82958.1 hypothetical protein MTY81_43310 [Mycolicibacterium sp. TY81]GCA98935.1 hypothetical protein NCCNTM_25700 [Mycolicibacterium sp. NCC-Tsukiji]